MRRGWVVGGDWGGGSWGGFVCQDESWGKLPAMMRVLGGGSRALKWLRLGLRDDSSGARTRRSCGYTRLSRRVSVWGG